MSTIHRIRKTAHFCQIPNLLARDRRLSYKARGILLYVLSQSDNWQTSKRWLEEGGTEGREAIASAVKELTGFGYLKIDEPSTDGGQFQNHVWHWTDCPTDDGNPLTESRERETVNGKPRTQNTEEKNTEEEHFIPQTAGAESKEALRQTQAEALYAIYPRKLGKQDGIKAIIKALKIVSFETLKEAVEEYSAAVKITLQTHGRGEIKFVPYPEKWFNAQRWLDDRSEWIKPPPKRTAYQVNTLIKSTQEAIDTHPANPESISGVDRPTEEQKAALRDLKTRLFNLREELNKIA